MREIKVFFKKNIIQLIIAVICIIITIKQMSTPFLFEYNWLTEVLFKQLPSEHYLSEILDILGNLAFAYYSGLIFYYIVEYFPTRRKEKQALKHTRPQLSELAKQLTFLISDLFFVAELLYGEKRKKELFSYLPELELSFDETVCNREVFCENDKSEEISTQYETFIPFLNIKQDCLSIQQAVEQIKNQVYYPQLEDDINEVLNTLMNNIYINHFIDINEDLLKNNNLNFTCNCTLFDISELIVCNRFLRKLPINRYSCKLTLSTKEEKKEINDIVEKMWKEHPESMRILEESLKQQK